MLDGVELFDAAFFGYSPREAEILDPQQRLFLECAWEALEDAGYDSSRVPGRSASSPARVNIYLHQILASAGPEELGALQLLLGNDKDFLATRVSYKLDLTGPSMTVQTACSTSLVAVHLACQNLLGSASATWRSPAASRSTCRSAPATSTRRGASSRPTATAAPSTPRRAAPWAAAAPASSC